MWYNSASDNMAGKTLIEVTVVSTEDHLDKVGALRNVAVNDAWKRVRQKIEVKSWKEAESVLGEVVNGLQKMNMSKTMSPVIAKLKTALQNPEKVVEESPVPPKETPRITPKETPRETDAGTNRKPENQDSQENKALNPENKENVLTNNQIKEKPLSMQQANELNRVRDGITELETFLETTKKKLDSEEVIDKLSIPANAQDALKPCYNLVIGICEKFRNLQSVAANQKMQIGDNETRKGELEKQIDEKDIVINKLSQKIEDLEKKNDQRKEAKMETFKEQMKLKSLEKNIEQKNKDIDVLAKESKDLKERLNAIAESKSSELADIGNPYPPTKLAEMYKELFKKEWKDVFEIQKKSYKRSENEAIERLLGLLKASYLHCKDSAETQFERLMEEFVYPCDNSGTMKGSQNMLFDELAQKQLNNLRKQTCTVSCEFAKNTFISHLEYGGEESYSLQEISDCLPFIEKCVELCWFFVLQMPAIAMETELDDFKGKTFDKEKFDPYGTLGQDIEFVVWPTLHYENDRTVVAKGVAKTK